MIETEKIWHIDLETGGLDPKTDGVVQIACSLDINGETVSRFDSYICPPAGVNVSDEALAISKISRETIAEARSERQVLTGLFSWLGGFIGKFDRNDKALMSGFNVGFDDQFLREMCARVGEKYLGSWKYADLYDSRGAAALYCLPARHLLPDFKLVTVANFLLLPTTATATVEETIAGRLGIEAGAAHDARIDVEVHRHVLRVVRNGGNCRGLALPAELEARAERERLRVQRENETRAQQ